MKAPNQLRSCLAFVALALMFFMNAAAWTHQLRRPSSGTKNDWSPRAAGTIRARGSKQANIENDWIRSRPSTFQVGFTMQINELPKWMNVIPTLIGVAFSLVGMYVLPNYGVRNTLGPIIGLPLGMILGVGVLYVVANRRG